MPVHCLVRYNTDYSTCSMLYSVQQGSPTYGPRAKCGPFQIPRSKKKVIKKRLGRLAKKNELMAISKKRFLIFPFFGPPSTKGWRPLVYIVESTM